MILDWIVVAVAMHILIGLLLWSLIDSHIVGKYRDDPAEVGCFIVLTVALWPVIVLYIELGGDA